MSPRHRAKKRNDGRDPSRDSLIVKNVGSHGKRGVLKVVEVSSSSQSTKASEGSVLLGRRIIVNQICMATDQFDISSHTVTACL